MIFFFKPKVIHLDCFTDKSYVYEYFPIVNSTKCYPDWWRNLPNGKLNDDLYPMTTMKQCTGVTDYFKKSVTMRLWSDMAIEIDNTNNNMTYRWYFSDEESSLLSHHESQYKGYFDNDMYLHQKFKTPWVFKTKDDIDWVVNSHMWQKNLNNELVVCNGLLNFKHQSSTNLQVIFKCPPGEKITRVYENDTPMAHFIPMSDKKIKIHNHLITHEEYERINNQGKTISFFGKYRKTKNKTHSKCPFHYTG